MADLIGTSHTDPVHAAAAHPAGAEPGSAASADCGVFLGLLDREAAAVEFERPLLAARAAGAPDEVLAALESGKLVALRIRGELEQRRRREAELAALFETASDLAALHDLDSVLRAIVRRARLLLRTDVAYLTLNDPQAGDTYMRVTSGSASADFQRLRLGLGEGLGGLVVVQAAPYAAADYLADQRFQHTGTIDRAVIDEGLVAILGVPLPRGSSVIGVLFAADRHVRTFSPAEVSLLCSMAAHAAIAIEAAYLLEETQAALTERNAANELIKKQSAAVERASQAHQRFTELILAGGNAADVARAVGAVLGSDVVILDEEDAPLAASGQLPPAGDPALPRALAQARLSGRAVCGGDFWAVPATAGSEHLGALVLRAGPDLADNDRLILERAAMVTALLLLSRRSVAEAERAIRGELLADLLTMPPRDPAALRDRALRLGADLDQPQVVVVADAGRVPRSQRQSAAAHLAATRRGLATEHDGLTVLLLPGSAPARIAREVAAAFGGCHAKTVTTGAAAATGGPAAVAGAYQEARRCLDALLTLGRPGESATLTELGFLGLLLSDRKEVPAFIRSAIGRLIDYDEARGTVLVATVSAYFAAGCNLAKAKDELHLHVNTVTQRLDRVTRLLGTGWQHGDRALEVRLAVHLYQLGGLGWTT